SEAKRCGMRHVEAWKATPQCEQGLARAAALTRQARSVGQERDVRRAETLDEAVETFSLRAGQRFLVLPGACLRFPDSVRGWRARRFAFARLYFWQGAHFVTGRLCAVDRRRDARTDIH